jgi:hypothetical protein
MIDPKINVRSQPTPGQPESVIADYVATGFASAVQTRAYQLYELGGRVDGRAEQDWYQAETDLRASSKQA